MVTMPGYDMMWFGEDSSGSNLGWRGFLSMRPELYAAYLHGASKWDGAYEPVVENGIAVYIFMAESEIVNHADPVFVRLLLNLH